MDTKERNKKELLEKKIWAVIGVTPNQQKFGYKIWKKLKENEYEVFAINPKYSNIEGDKCYSNLKELPKKPDVINFVVPPQVSLGVLEKAKELGVKYLWFQPGTSNEDVINEAEKMKFEIVFQGCVLVALS